jgi:hypothetical protein
MAFRPSNSRASPGRASRGAAEAQDPIETLIAGLEKSTAALKAEMEALGRLPRLAPVLVGEVDHARAGAAPVAGKPHGLQQKDIADYQNRQLLAWSEWIASVNRASAVVLSLYGDRERLALGRLPRLAPVLVGEVDHARAGAAPVAGKPHGRRTRSRR